MCRFLTFLALASVPIPWGSYTPAAHLSDEIKELQHSGVEQVIALAIGHEDLNDRLEQLLSHQIAVVELVLGEITQCALSISALWPLIKDTSKYSQ